ncbi:hypothetical protein AB3X52_10235 [Nocardioides sp. DS6]|uniref:Insertion element protein n=1 Tax=Nocardioides eburneus TaxID=3231482 RepID=A0ABV3T179_9ACTN
MSPDLEFVHCPYCGDTDLVPTEDDIDWSCRSCLRTFTVTLVAVGHPPASARWRGRG